MKFTYNSSLVTPSQLESLIEQLEPYRARLKAISEHSGYKEPESSLQLPSDPEQLSRVHNIASRLRSPTLQYVIVIGIGGSNLGAQAVYEAIAGSMNLLVDRLPKLLFLDTVTDEKMTAVTRVLEHLTNKDDFLVIAVSKSGTTTETIANLEVLSAFIKEQFGDSRDRFVCVTDRGSRLWDACVEHKINALPIPEQVGGRYSVLSAAGLLPLALAGIDIHELREGAQQAVLDGVSNDTRTNHALPSACLTFFHAQNKRIIRNAFFFSPKFETLGKWDRQLTAESLGKNGNGILPIVSIGSTDLHSMAQLYWGGPDNLFTNLIFSFTGAVHTVPSHLVLPGLVGDIHGKSLEQIMQAIFGGVKSAYEQANRPYTEINLESAGAWELGYYLQFRMLETMYLGALFGINAFDQPSVEMYKRVTKELLETVEILIHTSR